MAVMNMDVGGKGALAELQNAASPRVNGAYRLTVRGPLCPAHFISLGHPPPPPVCPPSWAWCGASVSAPRSLYRADVTWPVCCPPEETFFGLLCVPNHRTLGTVRTWFMYASALAAGKVTLVWVSPSSEKEG